MVVLAGSRLQRNWFARTFVSPSSIGPIIIFFSRYSIRSQPRRFRRLISPRPSVPFCSKCKNAEVMLAEVQSVDLKTRVVHAGDLNVQYDYLILATGARHSYFGHPEWERLAPGLKSLEDAVEIRRRILLAFEYAEKISGPGGRAAAMTFVIIGGGPTGVEMAGAIAEIARHTLAQRFPSHRSVERASGVD